MKRKGDWLMRLTEGMDLPAEAVPGQPLVELAGDCRVLIENHMGVTAYSGETICVKVKYGLVSVAGCGLELVRMTSDQLVIAGQIDGIRLLRRDC